GGRAPRPRDAAARRLPGGPPAASDARAGAHTSDRGHRLFAAARRGQHARGRLRPPPRQAVRPGPAATPARRLRRTRRAVGVTAAPSVPDEGVLMAEPVPD